MDVLRASAEQTGQEIDYRAITEGVEAGDTGIPHDRILIEFAEAVLCDDVERLAAARRAIAETLGAEALVDSAGVAGLFNAIDRVADSTGAPLEDWKAEQTTEIRAEIGIDSFEATRQALVA